jgi:hypothetical protein
MKLGKYTLNVTNFEFVKEYSMDTYPDETNSNAIYITPTYLTQLSVSVTGVIIDPPQDIQDALLNVLNQKSFKYTKHNRTFLIQRIRAVQAEEGIQVELVAFTKEL